MSFDEHDGVEKHFCLLSRTFDIWLACKLDERMYVAFAAVLAAEACAVKRRLESSCPVDPLVTHVNRTIISS